MLRRTFFQSIQIGLLLSGIAISSCKTSAQNSGSKDGFEQIFDGKTLNGWDGKAGYWRVENGNLTGEETPVTEPQLKANTFIIWKGGEPGDFELKAEYRISKDGNSGINYRSEELKDIPYALKGYQIDIDGQNQYTGQNYEERKRTTLAYRGQKVTIPAFSGTMESHLANNAWTSAIVTKSLGNTNSLKANIKDSGWNELHIIAKGNHLQHYINGVLMSDVTDNDTVNRKSKGLIGLQLHAGHIMKVQYRNIRLKQL